MSFRILCEAHGRGEAFYGYKHRKRASHWKMRSAFSLHLFVTFLYGMYFKIDEFLIKKKAIFFLYLISSQFIFL